MNKIQVLYKIIFFIDKKMYKKINFVINFFISFNRLYSFFFPKVKNSLCLDRILITRLDYLIDIVIRFDFLVNLREEFKNEKLLFLFNKS